MTSDGQSSHPHANQPFISAGAATDRAAFAVVMLHGRGGFAQDMLSLANHLALPSVAWFAPEASGNTWWPKSFLAPLRENEPSLSSGLNLVGAVVQHIENSGVTSDRTVIMGFSQGGCLALEYGARAGRAFHGIVAFSGGLVGTGEADASNREDLYGYAPKLFDYRNNLTGTTVFLGCHERDPHIPLARIRESESVFRNIGADVVTQIYPGAGHNIVDEEVRFLRHLLNG